MILSLVKPVRSLVVEKGLVVQCVRKQHRLTLNLLQTSVMPPGPALRLGYDRTALLNIRSVKTSVACWKTFVPLTHIQERAVS